MTFPVELKLGGFSMSLHLLFETLGFFVGFRYFLFLRRHQQDKINDNNRILIIIGATFGAFFFSRLVGVLEYPPGLFHSDHPLFYLYSNKTIVGGLLGGLLVVELTKRAIHERSSSGDLFTYPLMLAMMIGRIGCFTSGLTEQTYGNPTSLLTGIDLGDGLRRHPVALYEIVFLALLWLLLWMVERRIKLADGFRFQFFMIAYLLYRFLQDMIKPHYGWFFGLGTIQVCCLIGLVYYSRTIYKIITNFSILTITDGK